MTDDLSPAEVALTLGDRPLHAYPALLSTESDAMAWARNGAAAGAVVVADYQASPRGRGGLPWAVLPGRGLGFSLILRPELPPEREGWPYVAASVAVAEVLGVAGLEWPDTVVAADGQRVLARLGAYVELGPARTEWLTITVLIEEAEPPRAPLLASLVSSLEHWIVAEPDAVLEAYRPRCVTFGRQVSARMIPMGPGGPVVNGEAVDALTDGALVVLTAKGHRVAVPPQNLGLLEAPADPIEMPADVRRRLGDKD